MAIDKVARSSLNRTLSKANQTSLRSAEKHNEVFFNQLLHDLGGFGKEITAVGAASALDVAVTSAALGGGTKYDSGRAAANWDLEVGGKTRRSGSTGELTPAKYGESYHGVGRRGSGGVPSASKIPSIKALQYGYQTTMGQSPVDIEPNRWLWNAIGIGQPGRVAVSIYNPIMYALRRPDGFGRTYAQNAMPDLPSKDDFVRLTRTTVLMAGQQFVYEKIKKMNERVRKTRFSG